MVLDKSATWVWTIKVYNYCIEEYLFTHIICENAYLYEHIDPIFPQFPFRLFVHTCIVVPSTPPNMIRLLSFGKVSRKRLILLV